MQQKPPNSSFCPSWTCPLPVPHPPAVSGLSLWKCAQTQSNNTSKEMLWHSPASSFPLCCTGTVEGWHQDINGEVLGGRCGCPQGGKGTSWEPVSSRLHQWHCFEKQLLLQKNNFWSWKKLETVIEANRLSSFPGRERKRTCVFSYWVKSVILIHWWRDHTTIL